MDDPVEARIRELRRELDVACGRVAGLKAELEFLRARTCSDLPSSDVPLTACAAQVVVAAGRPVDAGFVQAELARRGAVHPVHKVARALAGAARIRDAAIVKLSAGVFGPVGRAPHAI